MYLSVLFKKEQVPTLPKVLTSSNIRVSWLGVLFFKVEELIFFPWLVSGACKAPSEWSGAPSLAVIEAEVNDSKMPVLSGAIIITALLWLVHWASFRGLDGCCENVSDN